MARPQPAKERSTLDRALSRLGFCSRSDAVARIRAGRVTVNGRVVRDPLAWISLRDRVACDGAPVLRRAPIVVMLHKPAGVVTSHGDPDGRATVYDLLAEEGSWLFPVGRLDKDTSGLLLLTNDTALGERLTNPASKMPKTYVVDLDGPIADDDLLRLERGVALGAGDRTLPARARRLESARLELTIVEGKNRQVRRMMQAVGREVVALARTRVGRLALGALAAGEHRRLTRRDLALLGE